jgi:hypothetical protein
MASLFKSPKFPSPPAAAIPPPPPPPTPLPDAGDLASKAKKRRAAAQGIAASGYQSTILSDDNEYLG